MIGIDFIADTNFLISLHEGNSITRPFLDQIVGISVISEIELLGWPKISDSEKRKLKALVNDCILIELSTEIKNLAINLRQKQLIKVPDAIIAATSIFLQVPLVTADQGFKNVKGIELILIS